MRSAVFLSSSRRRGAAGSWVVVTVIVAGAALLLWKMGGATSAGAVDVDPDRVVLVEARDVIDGVNATGRVEPLARVVVMSRASGIIEQLLVDEGDEVEVGQVLAELDREQLQVQLNQDQADVLAAEARVEAARARLAEAEARRLDPEPEFLRRETERLAELHASGNASVRELDEAKRLLANAEFRVKLVEANVPVLAASVTEAKAELAAAHADRERSSTALREATVLCPIDGVVLLREKEVGDAVSSILTAGGNATQIMTLGDLSDMHIEARVDEVDMGRIVEGMPALVTVDAHRGRVFPGVVERIAPAGTFDDNGIVTFEVEISVHDEDHILKPDMTADARLVIDRRDGVASLPQIALQSQGGGAWTVQRVLGEGDAVLVERVAVQLGLSDGLMTEIVEGLAPGDRVLLPAPPERR